MKKIIFLSIFSLSVFVLKAQSTNDYVLSSGAAINLPVNGKTTLTILTFDAAGDPVLANNAGLVSGTPQWLLNGRNNNSNPAEGTLSPDLTFLKATYSAPSKVPAKNPVAVSVSFHPNDTTKSITILVCNITIVGAQYKITLEGELTGPHGIHYKLSGESYTNLKSFADGTFGLMPADGTKNMQVIVSTAGVPGKFELVGPRSYSIPFVMNIGNISKSASAPAKISIETFSPTKNGAPMEEDYYTPVGIRSFPGNINNNFVSFFYKTTYTTAKENANKSMADLPFVQRLKQHENDPAYFRTAQGKADLLQMQKLMQEQGHGNMFQNSNTPPVNASAYSTAFAKGMKGTQTNPAAYGPAPNGNKPTVMGGFLHFTGTFNAKASTAMQITQTADPADGLHGEIKITVDRIK